MQGNNKTVLQSKTKYFVENKLDLLHVYVLFRLSHKYTYKSDKREEKGRDQLFNGIIELVGMGKQNIMSLLDNKVKLHSRRLYLTILLQCFLGISCIFGWNS